MKFNCGPSEHEKFLELQKKLTPVHKRISKWHNWFAWYPIRIGSRDCRWLETVERRNTRSLTTFIIWEKPEWQYRSL